MTSVLDEKSIGMLKLHRIERLDVEDSERVYCVWGGGSLCASAWEGARCCVWYGQMAQTS